MTWLLGLMVALPFVAAPLSWLLARRRLSWGYAVLIATTALLMAGASWLMASGQTLSLSLPSALRYGISLKADGFRALYAAVASLMWLMTSLLTPQYFAHGHSQGRYCLYTLLTMGATVGVFLSDGLLTAFLFFEILSFTSYCWVIHEETPAARRAGQTYVAIAILGGMAMLMGLMMLHLRLGTLAFDQLAQAAQRVDRGALYLPGGLILAGFGAKAGMFPLHVWLPKAHPVAPAPASALLSGVLTKVGVFGILVISSRLFFDDAQWGNLLLVLGLINMLLGALLALFSIDLKRTLACSSMSQIGFILFGVGMQSLLGEHNALAAQGTVLHMLNHSLIKLVLFMAAGVIYARVHQLNLNDIRGFGRRRFGLMACFLVGAASISGIPFFSGYASKTLLHESIVEYIDHLQALGHNALWYQVGEWAFVITGGLTFCYMLKLFITLFVQRHPTRQAEFDAMGSSMRPLSAVALGGSALLLFALGLRPECLLTALADRSLPFLRAHPPEHAVHYLAGVNLVGGGKSLLIGLLLYLGVVRHLLAGRDQQGQPLHLNRWPAWLDLENAVYRPALRAVVALGTAVCTPLDLLMDKAVFPLITRTGMLVAGALGAVERVVPGVGAVLTFFSRLLESTVDAISLFLMRRVLRPRHYTHGIIPVGNRFTYALGRVWDTVSRTVRRLFGVKPRDPHHYVFMFAAAWDTLQDSLQRMLRTLSFSLMLFAVGLVLLLVYLLLT